MSVAAATATLAQLPPGPPASAGRAVMADRAVDLGACVEPLLEALGWQGERRQILEVMPYLAERLELVDVLNLMAVLGFRGHTARATVHAVDERHLPALLLRNSRSPLIVVRREQAVVWAIDVALGRDARRIEPAELRGKLVVFERLSARESLKTRETDSWALALLARFKPLLMRYAGFSLLISLPALIVPLMMMIIYDIVLQVGDETLLLHLALASVVALAADLLARLLRARLLAHIATRVQRIVSFAALERVLCLAPPSLERASVTAQMRRVRQFESVADGMNEQLASVVLSVPYALLFGIAIFAIGGSVIALPLIIVAVFSLIVWSLFKEMKRLQFEASEARQVKDAMFEEIARTFPKLQLIGALHGFAQRFRHVSIGASLLQLRLSLYQQHVQTACQLGVNMGALATLVWGAVCVMDRSLTPGQLIAVMTLIWRMLGPWQQLMMMLPRLWQMRQEWVMLDQLMRLPPEDSGRPRHHIIKHGRGDIRLERVSMSFEGGTRPALLGLDLAINAGEMVGVTGESGAGKSTLLKIMMGFYNLQQGVARINGVNVRQLNPFELREMIAYAPQRSELFAGTIAQNLLIAQPGASPEQLRAAAEAAGVLANILALPEGFETRLGDRIAELQSPGFLRRLVLTRAYLRAESPILLLDEPGLGLDHEADLRLIDQLQTIKSKRTVVLVSHRPSHLKLADRVVVLSGGMIRQPAGPQVRLG